MIFFKSKRKVMVTVVITFIMIISIIAISLSAISNTKATPLLSTDVLFTAEYTCGPILTADEKANAKSLDEYYSYIDWPERSSCHACSDESKYMTAPGFVVRIYRHGIDVYNIKTREIKNILSNSHMQMSVVMTEKEICFSQWAVDIANWPIYENADGTYKYTFETEILEKISDGRYFEINILDERTLTGESLFGFSKKIKF